MPQGHHSPPNKNTCGIQSMLRELVMVFFFCLFLIIFGKFDSIGEINTIISIMKLHSYKDRPQTVFKK